MLSGLLKNSHILQRLASNQSLPVLVDSVNASFINKSSLSAFSKLNFLNAPFHSSSTSLAEEKNDVVVSPLSELVKQAAERKGVSSGAPEAASTSKKPVLPPLYARTGEFRQREAVQPFRTWYWYDHATEVEERKRELRQQMYRNVGMSYYLNIPQSSKKIERVLRMLRNLKYEEAWRQAAILPLKAARFIKEGLEHARKDAEDKGLDVDKLVLVTAYTAKGRHQKGILPMGKGKFGRTLARRTHLRLVLREDESFLPISSLAVAPSRFGGASRTHMRDISSFYVV